ncbi:MAG TPA: response regulator transcription factor [Rhodospirillaceae bacterium]|nr:response regulator transcription factor [Rhodospirillaceae bacterium]
MPERTVHLVDDDEDFRDSLRVLMEAHGFNVVAYADGRDFLDRLGHNPAGCAMVDVTMPVIGGLEVLAELARRSVSLPVIVMTGGADVPLAVQAMKAGAVDFIEKPLKTETLMATVIQALLADDGGQDGGVDGFRTRLAGLTEREWQVLEGVVSGQPTKVIAHELGISPRTVDVHRLHLNEKLAVTGLSNLVRLALSAGVAPGERWQKLRQHR